MASNEVGERQRNKLCLEIPRNASDSDFSPDFPLRIQHKHYHKTMRPTPTTQAASTNLMLVLGISSPPRF